MQAARKLYFFSVMIKPVVLYTAFLQNTAVVSTAFYSLSKTQWRPQPKRFQLYAVNLVNQGS